MAMPQQTPSTGPDGSPSRGRRVRRTAVIGAVALVCAAAIATPFVLGGGHDSSSPRSAPPSTPVSVAPRVPHGALTGDVDGDGRRDTVWLSRQGVLRIALGSGTTLRHLLSGSPSLKGLARVGHPGLAVVTSAPGRDTSDTRNWSVWRLHGAHLVRVPFRNRAVIGTEPGFETAWIDGHRLYDGGLDPLQKHQDHVAVVARSWTLSGGRLTATRAGVRCWDRSSTSVPFVCGPHQHWAYDAGPHGDLPSLLPADRVTEAGTGGVTFDNGESWVLRRATPPGRVDFPHMDLVWGADGATETIRVRPGFGPSMRRSPVQLDGETEGVLLSQEGGDSDTWGVYLHWGGRLQLLRTEGPVELGGGFTQDGLSSYISWMTPDGRLYTRIGTSRPGHDKVYAWVPSGGTATTAPVLRADYLGIVCIDDALNTYGTCAG
jgi:hypothetical protein